MEENSNKNTYIIQTVDLNNKNYKNDLSKDYVLKETPVSICSKKESDDTSHYITCYENGEIVLKQLDSSVLSSSSNIEKTELPIIKKKKKSSIEKHNSQELLKEQPKPAIKPRKKLCYEKPYYKQSLAIFPKNHPYGMIKSTRKQLIDYKIMISPREFKSQLNYTEDTVTKTKFAPCTRRQLLHVLNGITTLFAHPAHKMPNSNLMQLYVSRCTCKKEPNMMATDDMNLLPLIIETPPKPLNDTIPIKRIRGKRNNTEIPLETTQKIQIIENKSSTESNVSDSNINLSSIKKIYRNRKCNKESLVAAEKPILQTSYVNENIDHKYSKKIKDDPKIKMETEESISNEEALYSITLDLDNVKEEDITENQIVILSVDNAGELSENNIRVLLDAATMNAKVLTEEVLTLNEESGDFDKKVFVKNVNKESRQIPEKNSSDVTTS